MSFSYQLDICKKRNPQIGFTRNVLALAATCLLLMSAAKPADASPYSVTPYENVMCPCCVLPGQIMYEMFWGVLNWAGQDDLHNKFYIEKMFEDRIEPALKDMADELHTAAIAPALMIGAFIDGQAENNALNTVQKLNAETIKDYHVSDQICRVGTVSRSLAQSDDKARTVQLGMMEAMVGRQLLRDNYNSGDASTDGVTIGRSVDKVGRWNQLKTKFCDPFDINRGLGGTAAGIEKCEATTDKQANRDIDVAKTLEIPSSLNVNFDETTPTKTDDEENLIALGSNLYAHDLSVNLGASDLHALKTSAKDEQIKKLFDFRSLVAKRSVAENSFAAQAGMKAAGSGASKTYIDNIIKELGLSSATDIKALIGDNPSYDTQMEVLTKRLYQSPKFYVNLYDTPANVERQKTALKAISLMQDRDMYESLQRSEMLLSVMLELQVMKAQDRYFGKGQQDQ